MLPWKRKEVYMGMSQEECFQIRDKLDAAGIQSEYKVVGHSLLGVSGGGRKDGGDRPGAALPICKKRGLRESAERCSDIKKAGIARFFYEGVTRVI